MHRFARLLALVTSAALLVTSLGVNAFALTQSEVNREAQVTMRTTQILLAIGESATLDYSLELPDGAYGYYTYTGERYWFSTDTDVVRVDNRGRITACGEGRATVILMLSNGERGVCYVYVPADRETTGYYYPRNYRNYYDPENPYYWEDPYWQDYLTKYFYSRPHSHDNQEPYTVSTTYVMKLTKNASVNTVVGAVNASGATSLINYASVSAEALQAAAAVSSKDINFDTIYGDKVVGRLSFSASNAGSYTGTIQTGVYCDIGNTLDVATWFDRLFTNEVKVVLIDQPSFSAPVEIAIKVGTMDVSDLHFYTYDPARNTYDGITLPDDAYKDANQFLHFTTSQGGYIIVSDGELERI